MGRPRKISAEQILKAAQAVFLEKGFGASTLEIARKAGISEGSIFKRFETKEDLFLAAMGAGKVSSLISFMEDVVGQGDLKENLKKMALKAIKSFQELLPKMMMVRSKGLPIPAMMKSGSPPPVRNLKALTRFFKQEMALGRMRASDPQVAASMFVGSMMNYVFVSQISDDLLPECEVYVDSMVEIFWRSVRPDEV